MAVVVAIPDCAGINKVSKLFIPTVNYPECSILKVKLRWINCRDFFFSKTTGRDK